MSAADFDRVEDALRSLGSLGMNAGSPHSLRNDRKALDEEQAEGLASLARLKQESVAMYEALEAQSRFEAYAARMYPLDAYGKQLEREAFDKRAAALAPHE